MSVDQITAIGGAIAAILTAASAWQMKKVAELQARVGKLEQELEHSKGMFRAAVLFIRQLLRHSDQVEDAYRDGRPPPVIPDVPPLLKDEV